MECNSDDQGSPAKIRKKKYKQYKTDPNLKIPLRTINRWDTRKSDIVKKKQNETVTMEDGISSSELEQRNEMDEYAENNASDDNGEKSEENLNYYMQNIDDETENENLVNSESEDDVEIDASENLSFNDALYKNSKMSVDQSVYNLLNFYVKHMLSKSALKDALQMLLKALPVDNMMPKTVYKLLKYVTDLTPACQIIKHYYCRKCLFYIGEDKTIRCDACNETRKNFNFFFEFDIENQIRHLFENNNLAEKLKVFSANRPDGNIISDISDGSEYIRVNARSNRKKYDLTLILNTDGLSLVKSSKSHCWPLMYTIAELPKSLRNSFIIILGLWYDNDRKPLMNTFLQPFCSKIQKKFKDGINWKDPKTGETFTSTIVAPLFIADAPARAQIQNIMNFNGSYGCNICELQSKQSTNINDGRKTSRIYPFSDDFRLRVGSKMEEQAQQVSESTSKSAIKGVKGYSVLSILPLIDLGTCLIPEYMHSVLLGVIKQFVNYWTDKPGPWNIKKFLEEIDKLLLSIKPPQSFSRLPRTLTQLQFYKASEYYNLVLFYSLPIFVNYLPEKYFQHWILLVIALNILLQDEIKIQPDLEKAEELLTLFVQQIPILYNDRAMTYNVHQLLHLVLCVKRWGPLHVTSAFPFEDKNGYIANCVHSNKHIGQEIIIKLTIIEGLQMLKNRIRKDILPNVQSSKNWKLLGTKKTIKDLQDGERQLLDSNNLNYKNLDIYLRAKINNQVFTSVRYKITKTDSSTVEVISNSENSSIYGLIRFFFSFEEHLYFIIQRLNVKYVDMFCHVKEKAIVTHIIPVTESDNFLLIKLQNGVIIKQLIKVGNYVCQQPNNYYSQIL